MRSFRPLVRRAGGDHRLRPGDTIHVLTNVEVARESESRPDTGIVTLAHEVVNQDGVTAQRFTRTLLVAKRPAGSTTEDKGAGR